MKLRSLLPLAAAGLALASRLSAVTTPIDYFTGFGTPTQVITSDQPVGTIGGDPGTGVTFSNPHFFHFPGTLENYNPFTGGFGGSVTIGLPGAASKFGLSAGANSLGASSFSLDFLFGGFLVGSASFIVPSGQPSTPIPVAFYSDAAFDSVVLTAPGNGFMRINHDSIRFEAATVPDAARVLPLLLLALAGLALGRRLGVQA